MLNFFSSGLATAQTVCSGVKLTQISARFQVGTLPRSVVNGWNMKNEDEQKATSDHPGGEASPRILIIDDNPAIHDDYRKILQGPTDDVELGALRATLFGIEAKESPVMKTYELESAFQGEEGYQMACRAIEEGRPFSTAFVDMRMPPGWDGLETIRHLFRADPDLQILICTAYSDYTWAEIVEEFGHSDQLLILRKPFDSAEVCQVAAALTEKRRLTELSRQTVADLERTVERKTQEIRLEMERREITQQQLLEKEEQLRDSQKLEAVGLLAGGISHEFNNLLQIVLSYAQFALNKTSPEEGIYGDLECIQKAGQRATALTRQLLGFSRRKPLTFVDVDVNAVVEELVKMAKPLLGSRINVRQTLTEDCEMVHADPAELQQALLNLCINSRDAIDATGDLEIRTRTVELSDEYCRRDDVLTPGRFVCISMSDTGCGMSESVAERIFEPFYTTKEIGAGTGLGLAMVYGLVKQHRGHIDVESAIGVGTNFHIYLPAVESPTQVEPRKIEKRHTRIDPHSDRRTVLIADDEELLREVSSRILEEAGYRVLLANDGLQAVEGVKRYGSELDLVILDVMMPNMTGREAFGLIEKIDPDLPLMFCTGHDPEVSCDGTVPPGYPVVHKPFTSEALVSSVRETLDHGDPPIPC